MNKRDLKRYTVDQLASDSDFRRWVLNPDTKDLLFWQQFLAEHPDQVQKVYTAQNLVQASFKMVARNQLSPERKELLHNNLMDLVRNRKKSVSFKFWSYAAAAIITLLIGWSVYQGVLFEKQDPEYYATTFGERKQLTLPDHTIVDLNANSLLRLGAEWENGTREVWLDGEAYFRVEKKPFTKAKFIVHTKGLDIEVLGTQFNVNTRKSSTKVLLEEGKVKLLVKEGKEPTAPLYLAPGELADFSQKTGSIKKQILEKTQKIVSWKEGYLIYEKAALNEVINDIQSTYGLVVTVEENELLDKTISGAFPTDNLDEFLKTAEVLFGLKVTKNGNEIFLE